VSFSGATKYIPGIIFLTYVNWFDAAETILHEATHLWLNGIERVCRLVQAEDHLVDTPLRLDKRPLIGLLHQALVLKNQLAYYEDILARGDELPGTPLKASLERLEKTRLEYYSSAIIIKQNFNLLTDSGRTLCEQNIFRSDIQLAGSVTL